MKTYNLTEVQLKQIAKDSPQSKVKIKQWFPDVFAFKVGWYTDNDNYTIFRKSEDLHSSYGFFGSSFGRDWSVPSYIHPWVKMSNEKVISRLEAMLLESGIDFNTEYIPINGLDIEVSGDTWKYIEEYDTLYGKHGAVYSRGIIAEKVVIHTFTNLSNHYCWHRYMDGENEVITFIETSTQKTGFGFINGVPHAHIEYPIGVSVEYMYDREVVDVITKHCAHYTRDNIIPRHGIGAIREFHEDKTKWALINADLYTERPGFGGMLVYRRGVFAQTKEESIEW